MSEHPDTGAKTQTKGQMRHAARAAERLGWTLTMVPGTDNSLFELRKGPNVVVLATLAGTPFAINSATAYTIARDKGFTNALLAWRSLPVIPTEQFFVSARGQTLRAPGREVADARRYIAGASFPVFCKPAAGARGEFAEAVFSTAEFDAYLERLPTRYELVLVQPMLLGREYRVFVLEDRALFFYEKMFPTVTGDGVRSVSALAEADGREGVVGPFLRATRNERLDPSFVPTKGEVIRTSAVTNRTAGGRTAVPSTDVPDVLARLSRQTAREIGLVLAGIDLMDVSPNGDLSALVVVEANCNPGLETLEDYGRWDLIETVWEANLRRVIACKPSR